MSSNKLNSRSILVYEGMPLTVEWVTPAIAKQMLVFNKGNRRLRPGAIAAYARDMTEGDWLPKPVAICFDEEGLLGNGQHTLEAIVASGQPQWLLIARAVPRKSIAMMDRGVIRTLNDVAGFLGAEFESRKSRVARVMVHGPADDGMRSFNDLFTSYQEHKGVIDFVCKHAPRQIPGFSATAIAVMGRACYSQKLTRIQNFIDVVRSGEVKGQHETAAIRLRDFTRALRGANTREVRIELYRKTESALHHFLNGEPMRKLYGIADELYPMPSVGLGPVQVQ